MATLDGKEMVKTIKSLLEEQKTVYATEFENLKEKNKKLEELQETITKRLDEIEKFKNVGVSLPGSEDYKDKFSYVKMLNGVATGDWTGAELEFDICNETRKKATATTQVGSNAGILVPTEISNDLIELLRTESVIMSTGATVIRNIKANSLSFIRQTGGAKGYWVGENKPITKTDTAWGGMKLSPKKVACIVPVTNELLRRASQDVEMMVKRDMALALAEKIDEAGLRGTGGEYMPTGVLHTPGILNSLAIGVNGGDFTWAHAVQMAGLLDDNEALRGDLGFIFSSKIKTKFKLQRVVNYAGQVDGQPLISMPMSDAKLEDYLGYKFKTSNRIPNNLTKGAGTDLSEIYFGNWRELLIGQWGNLEFATTSVGDTPFVNDVTWFRVTQEVDMGLRHPQSFSVITDANTIV